MKTLIILNKIVLWFFSNLRKSVFDSKQCPIQSKKKKMSTE